MWTAEPGVLWPMRTGLNAEPSAGGFAAAVVAPHAPGSVGVARHVSAPGVPMVSTPWVPLAGPVAPYVAARRRGRFHGVPRRGCLRVGRGLDQEDIVAEDTLDEVGRTEFAVGRGPPWVKAKEVTDRAGTTVELHPGRHGLPILDAAFGADVGADPDPGVWGHAAEDGLRVHRAGAVEGRGAVRWRDGVDPRRRVCEPDRSRRAGVDGGPGEVSEAPGPRRRCSRRGGSSRGAHRHRRVKHRARGLRAEEA